MNILAGIMGILSLVVVIIGFGFVLLGHRLGTSERFALAEEGWRRKVAVLGFNYLMPAGIVTVVVLLPLLVVMGLVTFVAMLIL